MRVLLVTAGVIWLSLVVCCSFGLPAGAVFACAILLFVGLLAVGAMRRKLIPESATSGREVAIGAILIIGALASFGFQSALTQPSAVISKLLEFENHGVQLEVLDMPTRVTVGQGGFGAYANSQQRAHVRLLKINDTKIVCNLMALQPGCAVAGEVRVAAAKQLIAGQVIEGSAFLTPIVAGGRYSFVAKLDQFRVIASPPWFTEAVNRLQQSFTRAQHGLSAESSALVAGMTFGAADGLSTESKASLKTTGLTHLIAVSGANCVIVAGVVLWIVGSTRLSRTARTGVVLLTLLIYVALVGQQPSVLRAAVMFGSVALAETLGRSVQSLDSIGLSVIGLLVADPWLCLDFGFALSAAATLGIVTLQRPIRKKLDLIHLRRIPIWLLDSVAVVLAAQVLCLPIIIALSGKLPTYTLPANLLAEPLVTPITVLGIVGLTCSPIVPGLTGVLSWLASIPASWILWISSFFAGMPLAGLEWLPGPAGIAAAIAASLGILLLLRSRVTFRSAGASPRAYRAIGMVVAVSAAIGLAFGLTKPVAAIGWPGNNWSVVACDVGQGDGLVIRSGSQIAVVDVGREPAAIDRCLNRLGIARIDLLVLTHYDADHVAGLPGAIHGRTIVDVLETPWPDERPLAGVIKRDAVESGAKILLAEAGLSGTLGRFSWRVLSPSRTAAEAEDSNDGSITMVWESPDMNILTLADLGEKGQMRVVSENPGLVDELHNAPLVLKVAHHGSADCYPELYEALQARVALISVGKNNGYGHPTKTALDALAYSGSAIERTDLLGSIAVSNAGSDLAVTVGGGE